MIVAPSWCPLTCRRSWQRNFQNTWTGLVTLKIHEHGMARGRQCTIAHAYQFYYCARAHALHFHSVYELVSSSHTTCESGSEPEASLSDSTKTTASAVRLFYDSLQPVTLDRQHTAAVGKQVEETASKTCLVKVKRKRKEPPRCIETIPTVSYVTNDVFLSFRVTKSCNYVASTSTINCLAVILGVVSLKVKWPGSGKQLLTHLLYSSTDSKNVFVFTHLVYKHVHMFMLLSPINTLTYVCRIMLLLYEFYLYPLVCIYFII